MSYAIPLEDFVRTLNRISDYYDVDTKDHSRRSRKMSMTIGKKLGAFNEEDLLFLGMGADIHDVGKVAIDRYILRQAAKLTRAQKVQVQLHPVYGLEIIQFGHMPKVIKDCVLYHHEHFDGSGYPHKLVGHSIPMCARVVCISDVWDAITSDRPYRKALPFEKALHFMSKNSVWFDPEVFAAFLDTIRYMEAE